MKQYKFDVIIIGAGPAGVAAAGALSGTGISVALLEAGVYAGAENWSGCVYFAENLAAADCFGSEAVAGAPFERRVARRGTLMHNGLDVVGLELTDPDTFKDCYTVLRPVYDPYFAQLARNRGIVHLTGTTVTSLLRKDNRVVGVQTNRGPLYSEVVFLAEGDASHLVRSERLERVQQPHFLQGVKAVLSLSPEEIEKRFKLEPGQGAAYELLIRNPGIGGRTAKLNAGGFLYTNLDSLSLGYVVPLDHVRDNYRGSHDRLFEWVSSLPYIKELTDGATLSAYGAKLIRSGGWKERPILIEDGLAIGGASACLGVDIPFPNFTGPASATGLYFGRAVKKILKRGAAMDKKNLSQEYLTPLLGSVYARNARYLDRWPGYFSRSRALFNRTVDMTCGTARFLSHRSIADTARVLRPHLLSVRGVRESVTDVSRMIGSLRLWKPVAVALVNPATYAHWLLNLVKRPARDPKLRFILRINNKDLDAETLAWPIGNLAKRLSPALSQALAQIYANDGQEVKIKLNRTVRALVRGLRMTDIIVLPAYGLALFLVSLGTALWDAFRFYVLKTPVDTLLSEPVMAYDAALKKARDLDAVKPRTGLEAKLATNSYRIGTTSHIRTLWPKSAVSHPDLSGSGLWRVCPARVYVYDAPLFGRGKVTVNFENCIKCESCWRSEPAQVQWGRHTDHQLVYRPETKAIDRLRESLRVPVPQDGAIKLPEAPDEQLWYLSSGLIRSCRAVLAASAAFRDSIANLPASADAGRRAWPHKLGKRLLGRLAALETALSNDGRYHLAASAGSDCKEIEARLTDNELFPALYCCARLEQRVRTWINDSGEANQCLPAPAGNHELSFDTLSISFPDRIVKQWEEGPLPGEWAEKLHAFFNEHHGHAPDAVRALSTVSPALGLIAMHQLSAADILARAGLTSGPGICVVPGAQLAIEESADAVRIRGELGFVPTAACAALLIIAQGKGYLVPLATPGVAITPTPAIGFRAAGLASIKLDCSVKKLPILTGPPSLDASYLAIALGAAEYLSARAKEHASGRVQFPGQMLDTEGRDGIAKLGAVKAMISRIEAWRQLLQTLFDSYSAIRNPQSAIELDLLCSTLAAMAFGPDPGSLGYDAGQVFGGFAYSEDDLLSRSYRDSSLFRFLAPGYNAAARLHTLLGQGDPFQAIPGFGDPVTVQKEPLGPLASRLQAVMQSGRTLTSQADPGLAGEARALAIALRGLLSGIEKGLDQGRSMEAEAAATEVLLATAEDAVMKATLSQGRGGVALTAVFPIEPIGKQAALDRDYEAFCTAPGAPHRSGGFLAAAFDRSPRFVPEMQLHDPKLRRRWSELAGWFKENCRDKDFDGLHLERYIEKIHGLPDGIVRAVKERKWLATTIPASEDGLGWKKAEYYILNSVAGSFGDAGINLLIMASTSIGTTPILLGLEDELPRVREELAPLAGYPVRLGEIGSRLDRIVRSLANPNPGAIKKEYEAIMKLVDARIRHTRVVKYLAANFLRAFYGAGLAGRRGDLAEFVSLLRQAGALFSKATPDVQAALAELPRRERCHRLFLRMLGHNGVSAFALTEPTAGSDSGGVKTGARLTSSWLTPLPDGRYSFRLDEQDDASVRCMIDADKIVFLAEGMAYKTPDGGEAPILYDRYDYAADRGTRYYRYQGKDCEFHDIGQVRELELGPAYAYYVLTGAKMWITNGSIATQFCLYARTAEGVTGFLVDRHAEGLKVGADERKTGQRGSPTNELSIDSVRVPREAVIGYEGHGQVNALETLNVGRCGLAVVSGALIRKLMHEASANLPASPERDRLLGEAAAIQFGSESLAYYLVGLFDRKHESVRMESAIAKFACSEDIHEIITLVEQAYGPEGQLEKYLLEKARRDSRILTIYEGTNEVQRFLILKDLIALAAQWPEVAAPGEDAIGRMLANRKNALRTHVRDVAGLLNDTAWSDAMLQPALFPLAEMAGELLRLECIHYRLEWLAGRTDTLGREYTEPLIKAGERATVRTQARLMHLEAAFISQWEQIKLDTNPAEVRAADAALDAMQKKEAPVQSAAVSLLAPLRILSIVRPIADLSPAPRLAEGKIREFLWQPDPLDLSGLVNALRLKTEAASKVVVDVLLPGTVEHEHLLRTAAGSAADRLIRLQTENAAPSTVAEAVRTLELLERYDLILIGAACLDNEQGTGAFLAGLLKRTHYQREQVRVRPDGRGLEQTAPGAIVSITGKVPQPLMDMQAAIASAHAQVTVLEAKTKATSTVVYAKPAATAVAAPVVTTVQAAADHLKASAQTLRAAAAEDYAGEIVRNRLSDNDAVWAMLDPGDEKANQAVLRAGALLASLTKRRMIAIVPAPKDRQPSLLGMARANGATGAFCVDTGKGMLSIEGKRETVRLITRTAKEPLIVADSWWTDAFGIASGEALQDERRISRYHDISGIAQQDSVIALSSPAYEGRLIRREPLAPGAGFMTVSPNADFPVASVQADFSVAELDFTLDAEWLMALPAISGPSLEQAEVIIDLGYGIRDQAGLALARELKDKLASLGLAPMFGATRKVTQDLKLLPLDAQIGQTGVRVDPKLIIALGISGAPQHLDYLGARAEILCFNKDPEAPLMNLNKVRPFPRVHPIEGDLFKTVQELITRLG